MMCFKMLLVNLLILTLLKTPLRLTIKLIVNSLAGGKLHYAPISDIAIHPMISPSKHHHTSILIDDVHLHEFHFGDDHVLSCVRNLGYWPINGRNAVRAILK